MTISRCAFTALTVALLASGAFANETAHWTYDGETGPANWGKINKEFSQCESGRAESPIDVTSAKKAPTDMARVQFRYGPLPLHLLNTGHAMQFVAQPGKDMLTLGSDQYKLVQFHFHAPGEERFAGKTSPLDMHLVHANADGKLLVVAVQFVTGAPNPVLDAILNQMPSKPGDEETVDAVQIDPSGLLPAKLDYYTYSGSLTTPPCSEGVTWIELKQPVTIAPRQLEALRKMYNHNQRPAQPLNGREILEVNP
jgi:carbonic anhydrase